MVGDSLTPDYLRRQMCARVGAGFASMLMPGLVSAEHIVPASRFKAGLAKPFQLNYDGYLINRMGTNRIASAKLIFAPNKDRYELSLTVDSFLADLHYKSAGRVGSFGLLPETYYERRKIPFRREKIRQVRYEVSKDPSRINQQREGVLIVPPNTQDRISLLVHVSLLAQENPQLLEAGHDLSIPFARTNRVDASRWQVGKPEQAPRAARAVGADDDAEPVTIQAAVKPGLQAQQIKRRRPEDSKKLGVAFWLSDDAARLPLVIQFAEKGRVLKFISRN